MRELKYPHFLKCIEFTDDIFWKNVFEELSFGVPPYNTFIKKDYIISNVKNKEFNYKINREEDTYKVFVNLYELLYNKFGLISDIQLKEDELNFENQNKKKVLKNSVIEEFCTRKSKEYNLDIKDTKKIINYINLSLVIRNINSNDIEYDDNGYIIQINGIDFNNDEIILDDIFENTSYTNNDIITDYELMINNWTKYINNLIK